jgi:hypothetical protein
MLRQEIFETDAEIMVRMDRGEDLSNANAEVSRQKKVIGRLVATFRRITQGVIEYHYPDRTYGAADAVHDISTTMIDLGLTWADGIGGDE